MAARIYQPTKTAMQSGRNKDRWLLEFIPEESLFVEPLMGWVGSPDTTRQIQLWFDSAEKAVEYANKNAIPYTLIQPKARKKSSKAYASNFSFTRKIGSAFAQQGNT